MTKSELIEILSRRQPHLKAEDVDLAVKALLEMMGGALAQGDRIEIRGFGSFALNYRPPRTGRNPKSGEKVQVPEKWVPHFKAGKELRERVDKLEGNVEARIKELRMALQLMRSDLVKPQSPSLPQSENKPAKRPGTMRSIWNFLWGN